MLIAASAGAMVLSACVSITTTSLPAATDGVAYGAALSAMSNGTTPYTWAVTSGTLPVGLEISASSASTGVISGVPTGTGTSTFTVTVTDSTGATANQSLSIAVSAGSVRGDAVGITSDGYESYCAVLTAGGVDCWGYNADGELGDGTTTNADVPVATGITNAVSVGSDADNSYCAVLSTGGVDCWGYNGYEEGALGDGTTTGPDSCGDDLACSTTPVAVTGITDAVSLAADDNYATSFSGYCALLSTGGVDCWGDNAYGQLGNGSTTNSDVPVAVSGITNASSVAEATGDSYCAVLATGGVDCWGNNVEGELGNGTTASSDVPIAVTGITNATSVVADDNFVNGGASYCAVLSTGGVECWGLNASGELGNGTTTNSDVPVAVTGITDVANISSDGDNQYCAVLSTGGVDCWGTNDAGGSNDAPVALTGITDAANVSGYFCAVLTTGGVDCWVSGGSFDGGTYAAPGSVAGITDATSMTVNPGSLCAVLTTGGVDCAGYNSDGSLGDGTTTNSLNVPVPVTFLGS